MAQNSVVIADGTGLSVLNAINAALQTLITQSSGASQPATMYALQQWLDTASGIVKQRNAANTGWVNRGPLAETIVIARSSNTALAVSDLGRTIAATGTFTQTFNAASGLGDGWWVEYRNDGTGVITLDPNASETIDGATTITLLSGETCTIWCDGTKFLTVGRIVPVAQTLLVHGQCQLTLPAANLVLTPYNGNQLIINGIARTVPSAGVSLAPTSLTPSTLYYIYAYMSGSTMTLEASTTAYATDTATGVRIKTGDATRTLVGMALCVTGPAWQLTNAQQFVRSWFNDPGLRGVANLGSNATYSSTTVGELLSTWRAEFLAWAGEDVLCQSSGIVSTGTASTNVLLGVFVDAGQAGTLSNGYSQTTVAAANGTASIASTYLAKGLTEGYHYAGGNTRSINSAVETFNSSCNLTVYSRGAM